MPHSAPRGSIGALVRDRRGVVGLYFALVMGAVALLGVAALDLIRVHLVRSHLAMAVDSAILAAGRSLGTDTWQNVGVAYFNANLGTSPWATIPALTPADFKERTVGTGQDIKRVTLTVNATVPMLSKGLGNIANMDVSVTAVAERRAQTVDLAMVLDNTGSMLTNNNIAKLRSAATTLVTALANGRTTLPFSRVAVVPYAVAVNVGIPPAGAAYPDAKGKLAIPKYVSHLNPDDYNSTVAHALVPGTTFDPGNALGWHGCVLETAGLAVKNLAGHSWRAYTWENALDNFYDPKEATSVRSSLEYGNDGGGPNLGCPETPITPLTANVSYLNQALANMQAWNRGGTLSDVGLAWGARVLSPEPPFAQGMPWNDGRVARAIVLMTDGDANFHVLSSNSGYNKVNPAVKSDYGAYGRLDQYNLVGKTDIPAARTWVEDNLTTLCTTLKAAPFNVHIYTVTFGNLATTTQNTYRNCASTPEDYFPTADGASLTAAFSSIGGALNELVLVQ